jgi:hypothetical protein
LLRIGRVFKKSHVFESAHGINSLKIIVYAFFSVFQTTSVYNDDFPILNLPLNTNKKSTSLPSLYQNNTISFEILKITENHVLSKL